MTLLLVYSLLLGLVSPAQDSLTSRTSSNVVRCEYREVRTISRASDRDALAAACRALIESEPTNADAYLILGYAVMEDSVAALEVAEAGLAAVPGNALIQFNAGLTFRRNGQYDRALGALERAAALDITEGDPLIQAGLIATSMGQLERAVSYLQDATERVPGEPTAWGYLARAEAALGRHADAVRHWDRAQKESAWKYLYRHGDQEAYDSSLAIAPDAHVPPSQLLPTLRLLGFLAIPALLAVSAAMVVLRWGRARWKARELRTFVALAAVHFIASSTLSVVTIGAAYGAHQGWPSRWLDGPLISIGSVLVLPIVVARSVLPSTWGIGYAWPWMLLNSLLWAAAGTLVARLWRSRRTAGVSVSG